MSAWKPITQKIQRKVLVTNNIEGRNAHGAMSHVWITILVQQDKHTGRFVAMDDAGWALVENLTHYAELPK